MVSCVSYYIILISYAVFRTCLDGILCVSKTINFISCNLAILIYLSVRSRIHIVCIVDHRCSCELILCILIILIIVGLCRIKLSTGISIYTLSSASLSGIDRSVNCCRINGYRSLCAHILCNQSST